MSVIIPVYNRADLIRQTLSSVVRQTYRPLEIIIVNDGSQDETGDLVCRWREAKTDNPGLLVRYIYQDNAGAPAARNRGTLKASGEFIQYLDSDDLLEKDKIRLQKDFLDRNPNCDFAYGPVKALEDQARTIYAQREMTPERFVLKQASTPALQTAGPLCRREMLAHIGRWREDVAPMDDWELFSRAAVMGCVGGYVPNAIVYHRTQVANRLSWSGEPERLDQYVYGRLCQLESMLAHATAEWAQNGHFRDALAWNLMRVIAEGVKSGWQGDDIAGYVRAGETAGTLRPRLVSWSIRAARRYFGRRAAASYGLTYSWVYWRFQAVMGRLRRSY